MKAAALALFLSASLAYPAEAAILNLNIKLYGSDFRSEIGTVAPIGGELVDFDISFDDARDIEKTASGLRIKSSNLGWTEPLYYAYLAFLDGGILSFGTDPSVSAIGVAPFANSFGTFVRRPGGAAQGDRAFYTMSDDLTYEQRLQAVVTPIGASAVPEPEAWLLLSAGFCALGIMLRRRKASVHVRQVNRALG